MVICSPSDEDETRKLLTTAYEYDGPAAVRYPRGIGPNSKVEKSLKSVPLGKSRLICEGNSEIIMLNFGALLNKAKKVAENLKLTLIDMRFVKPLDEKMLKKYLSKASMFVSIEDACVKGGAGSLVQEFCSSERINIQSVLFGIPDQFIEHASRDEMLDAAGLTSEKIESKLKKLIE